MNTASNEVALTPEMLFNTNNALNEYESDKLKLAFFREFFPEVSYHKKLIVIFGGNEADIPKELLKMNWVYVDKYVDKGVIFAVNKKAFTLNIQPLNFNRDLLEELK